MNEKQIEFIELNGNNLALYQWKISEPKFLILLIHGYGEHLGRYEGLARKLNASGALVFGIDYTGHGLSSGERVLIDDFESLITNMHTIASEVQKKFPSLKLAIIGHSMGGMIATRYVQNFAKDVSSLVLSGPLLGTRTKISDLATLVEIPNQPIDGATLSRDPEVAERYKRDNLVWHGTFKLVTLQAIQRTLDNIHKGKGFAELPVLWIHGESDSLVLLEQSKTTMDKLQGTRLTKLFIPDGRHENFNEIDKERTIDKVVDFIYKNLLL